MSQSVERTKARINRMGLESRREDARVSELQESASWGVQRGEYIR